jgi:hypothetical protein
MLQFFSRGPIHLSATQGLPQRFVGGTYRSALSGMLRGSAWREDFEPSPALCTEARACPNQSREGEEERGVQVHAVALRESRDANTLSLSSNKAERCRTRSIPHMSARVCPSALSGPITPSRPTSGSLRGTSAERADQLQRSGRSSPISLCNAIISSSFKSVLRSSCRRAQPFTMSCNFCWSNPGLPLVAAYSTTRRRQKSRSSIAAHSPPMPATGSLREPQSTSGKLRGATGRPEKHCRARAPARWGSQPERGYNKAMLVVPAAPCGAQRSTLGGGELLPRASPK